MVDWYDSLSGLEQVLFIIAIFSTAIFALQLLMTMVGLAGDDLDMDAGSDGDSFDFGDIFTIRNGVSFLMGFSWGGLMAEDWGFITPLIFLVGFLIGSFFVGINIVLFLALSRFRSQGNIQLENAIDEPGTVTLTVPANRSGVGKVKISIQGRLKEYHAITDGDALAKNTSVTVLDLAGSQLIVGAIQN